jgi:hypothetical protein
VNSRNLKSLIELADKAGFSTNPKIRKILAALAIDWDDDIAESLEQFLMARALPNLINPFSSQSIDGNFKLGYAGNSWFGLNKNDLMQGVLVVGRSGAGKTNLFYFLMEQFLDAGIPFLAFDFKQDYRHLSKHYPDLVVIPWEKFKFNPLSPPVNVSQERWVQIFCDVFCHSNALLSGSKNFLLGHVSRLFELSSPSMHELAGMLSNVRHSLITKDSRYLETTRNRVNAMLTTIGCVLDCSSSPIEELLSKSVVLELDGMAEDVQNFLIESLLAWIYHYRLANNQRGSLRHVIFFDEAKRVFDINKERMPEAGIPTIDLITDRAREFGEAFIVADQEPSKLTDSIKANTMTKIMLALGSGKDIGVMSHSIGLNREQVVFAYRLKTGQGIAKVSGYEPFLIKIPFVKIEKDVRELRAQTMSFAERIRSDGYPDAKKQISENAEKILISVAEFPLLSMSQRYQFLGISSYNGNKIKEELVSKGFAREVEVYIGKRGRSPKMLDLAEQGMQYLRAKGRDTRRYEKGGVEHRFWQDRVREYFKGKGCSAITEYYIGRESVDVFVKAGEKRIAVEIALRQEHQVENVLKDLNFGFDQVIVACKNGEVYSQVKKNILSLFSGEPPKCICFCLLEQFYNPSRGRGFDSDSSGKHYKDKLKTNRKEKKRNLR